MAVDLCSLQMAGVPRGAGTGTPRPDAGCCFFNKTRQKICFSRGSGGQQLVRRIYRQQKTGRQYNGSGGLRIAVLKGSIQETVLKRLVKGFSFQVDFIQAPSFEKAFRQTADGTADAVVANHFFGNFFYQQFGLKKTPIAFNPVELYFATVSGANHELLKAIDED